MKILFSFFVITVLISLSSCSAQKNKETSITKQKVLTTDNSEVKMGNRSSVVMQKILIPIDGMVCMACQSTVKKSIKSLEGVTSVQVSFENKNALITFDPNIVKPRQFQKAINDKGYSAGKPQEVK